MEVGSHSPYPKTQQRHRQGHLIQAHIPPLSNCKDTGEEPSSLHNSKHTKHQPMQHGYKTQHSTVTALHTLNTHRSKMVQPNGSSCANNHCSTRYEQSSSTQVNIHTLIRKLLQTTNIPGTIIRFIANYIKGRKAYTTYRNSTPSKQRQF